PKKCCTGRNSLIEGWASARTVQTMAERRRHKRATAQGLASYVWVGNRLSSAIIENISAGGLFYRAPKPVVPGTVVRVRLVQPGLKESIELTGSVVSAIEPSTALEHGIVPGSGIRFDPVPESQRERFNRLLGSLGLPPIEVQPAPAARPPETLQGAEPVAASNEPGQFSYRVYKAEAKLDLSRAQVAQVAPVVPVAVEPKVQPQPIEFEIAPPAQSKPGAPAEVETRRLMAHIQGLLKQLTAAEEKLRLRDREIAELRAELDEARAELASYKMRSGR
ncbi:MAG: PilZ domain-containing protein, partial [Deltaproteobacteria bacterium]|nr:PilZ domain-containing protein [Deltaproteobacteria bacterium]